MILMNDDASFFVVFVKIVFNVVLIRNEKFFTGRRVRNFETIRKNYKKFDENSEILKFCPQIK
jgi:hypothetical protein